MPVSLYPQIIGNGDVCLNNISYYSSNAIVSNWNVSGGNSFVQISNGQLQVLWKQVGTFVITSTITDNHGQTISETKTVNVHELPSPDISPLNSNLCTSLLPTVGAALDGRTQRILSYVNVCYTVCDSGWYVFSVRRNSGSVYSWQSTGNSIIIPFSNNGDTVKVKWGTIGATQLQVSETDSNGCVGTSEICIQVIESPTSCFSSAPEADANGIIHLCLNSPLSLNGNCSHASYGSNIVTRRWVFGDGSTSTNTQFAEHTYSQAGTFQVMLIVESNCSCIDTFFRTVIVEASPGPDIFCINSVCHDSVSTFTTSSTCNNLFWSVTGGTFSNGSSATNDSITVIWGNGNSGYGTVSLLENCSGSCPVPTEVYVPILPANASISGRSVVCNPSLEIYSVPYVPTTQYTWYVCGNPVSPPCPVISTSNSNSISYVWSTNAQSLPDDHNTLVVYYTNPFLGCSGSSQLPITIASSYNLVGDTILCQNGSTTIQAMAGITKVYCNWDLYDYSNSSTSQIQVNDFEVTLSNLAAGYYTLYSTSVDNDWCGNPQAINIKVIASPATPTSSILGPDTVCAGSLTTYITSAAPNGLYLDWNAPHGSPTTGTGESFSTIWTGSLPAELKLRYVMVDEPGCNSDWLTKNIYPESQNIPNITGDATVCGDDTVRYEIGAHSAADYRWYLDDPLLGSITGGQHTGSALIQWNHHSGSPVNGVVNVDVTKCGSVITRSFTVTVSATPTGSLTAATSPFCVGKEVTLTASPSGGSNYSWIFGDGTTLNTASNDTTRIYNGEGTYSAQVTISNPGGCQKPVSAAVVINVLPGPAAILSTGSPTNHCNTGWSNVLDVTLQNMNGNGFTYQLYKDGIHDVGAGSATSYTVTQTGSYYVDVISATGCHGATNTIDITSNCSTSCTPNGTITLSTPTVNCGEVTISATTGSGVTFDNIVFYDPFGGAYTSTTATNATYTFSKAGVYRIRANGTAPALTGGGTCPTYDETWVTIAYVPDFTVQYACSSNVMQVHLIDVSTYYGSSNSIDHWTWYWDNSAINPPDQQNPIKSNPGTGSHTVSLEVAHGSQTACGTSTRTINVPAPAQASFISVDSVCETDAVQFISTSTGNIVSYLWDYGDGSYSALQNSSKTYISCEPGPFQGNFECIYAVTLNISDAYGCTSEVSHDNSVFDYLLENTVNSITPPNAILCCGQTQAIAVNIVQTTYSTQPFIYNWSDGVVANSSPRNVSSSNSYSVTVVDKVGCKLQRGNSDILFECINGKITGDSIFCDGQYLNLSIFIGHNYTYEWLIKPQGASAFINSGVTLQNPYLFNPKMQNGNYNGCTFKGIVISPNGCRDTTVELTVHSFPKATAPVTVSFYPNSQCGNNLPIVITATSTDASSFLWGNGVYGNSITADAAGTYAFIKIDTNGCKSDSLLKAKVIDGPDFAQLVSGCYNRCIGADNTLYAPVPPAGISYAYQWILNDSAVVSTSANFNPQGSGTYTLAITETYHGSNPVIVCTDTSPPIYLTLSYCPNTWCTIEGVDTSCVGCHYDSLTNTRVMEFILGVHYSPASPSSFIVSCSTADVNAYDNSVINNSGQMQSVGHNLQHGLNNIRVEIWDTQPQQSSHEIFIIAGTCQIPVTIHSPSPCY